MALFAALLALASQLVTGVTTGGASVGPPDAAGSPDQQLASLLADPGALCHSDVGRDAGGDQRNRQTPHQHGSDCMLCPCCAPVTASVLLGSDPAALPRPRDGPIFFRTATFRSTFLPPPPRAAATPRGPPILA
jgi:hypothetical protein